MTGKIIDHRGAIHIIYNVITWMYVGKHFVFTIPTDQVFKDLTHEVCNKNEKTKMIELNIGYIKRIVVN